ncbi:ABC transporter substrate-binding protein [Microbacterium sp.]|uniref:ABC transporter substrate-binding protein n=1 Tax=Microbacterium sp. TaxID=51671 RepID=UPI0039E66AE2
MSVFTRGSGSAVRARSVLAGFAIVGAGVFALSGCSSSTTPAASESATSGATEEHVDPAANCEPGTPSTGALQIATILPQTGNLAYLNPPAEAGSGLAIADINAAGGVLDQPVVVDPVTDSGGAADMSVSTASANEIVSSDAQVVLGAESSGVTLNFIDTVMEACRVQISPANTADTLSGYSSYFFRTAPPDRVQGPALGNVVLGDGNSKVAFLVFNDPYGTGLRDQVEQTIVDGGGEITYGASGDGTEFPPGQETFSSEVTAAIDSGPDAIVVLAFDETKKIIPELQAQGWDMTKLYFSDGNTASYADTFEPGTLEGAQGTIPGYYPDEALRTRLNDFYKSTAGADLTDFSYSLESYDAITLAALAAQKGGGTDAATIQANLAAVSGADGGEECEDFASCKALLDEGKDIAYKAKSAIGPFNEQNDPSSAQISVYKYDSNNVPVWFSSVEMDVTVSE